MEAMFVRVDEAAQIMGVSESYAYKVIQKMNKQLREIFDLYSVYFALAGGKGQRGCPYKC